MQPDVYKIQEYFTGNKIWLHTVHRRRKRGGTRGTCPPLEIILLYCAPPAVLVWWAWPTCRRKCDVALWEAKSCVLYWVASILWPFFILLLYLREQLTFSLLVRMPPRGFSTTLSTHRQVGRSFGVRVLPSTFSLPKTCLECNLLPRTIISEAKRSNSFVACLPCCSNLPPPMILHEKWSLFKYTYTLFHCQQTGLSFIRNIFGHLWNFFFIQGKIIHSLLTVTLQ